MGLLACRALVLALVVVPLVTQAAPEAPTRVLVVEEAEFARGLSRLQFKAATPAITQASVELAAQLSGLLAGPLVGRTSARIALQNGPVVVARSIVRRSDGTFSLSGVYVAAISGLGETVTPIQVDVPSTALARQDAIVQFGIACGPIAGPQSVPLLQASSTSIGLPTSIDLNAERAEFGLVNASSVELRVFPRAKSGISANRYLCGPKALPNSISPLVAAGSGRWSVASGAVLLSEADYLAATGQNQDPRGTSLRDAAHLTSAANHPLALAIEGSLVRDFAGPATLAVIGRNLVVEGERVRASEFYVAPWPVGGRPALSGLNLFVDFGSRLPSLDFSGVLCGPVSLPEVDPRCSGGYCDRLPTWDATQGAYGTDRFTSGASRVTMRWPKTAGDLEGRIRTLACTLFRPPLRDPPRRCDIDVFSGQPMPDLCNGLDDNCNGYIDEGIACSIPLTCSCQPRGCGTTSCGSIPDGCGNVISCGGACP